VTQYRLDEQRPVALVTGGNRGIGRGIVQALARRGFDLVINDLSETPDTAQTLALVRETGARAAFLPHDIAKASDHAAYVDAVYEAFGALDCLVNNAGVLVRQRGDILDVTEEAFDLQVQVNLRGTFFLTQAVARRMVAAAPGPFPRSIITNSSSNAFLVSLNRAEYCISKSALAMMNKLFAVRLADAGIMCFEVRPGIIEREGRSPEVNRRFLGMIEEGLTPVRRMGTPADLGEAVAMLASGSLPFCTGEALHLDGGFHIHRAP